MKFIPQWFVNFYAGRTPKINSTHRSLNHQTDLMTLKNMPFMVQKFHDI